MSSYVLCVWLQLKHSHPAAQITLRSHSDHSQITVDVIFYIGIVEIFSCNSSCVENMLVLYIGTILSSLHNSQVPTNPSFHHNYNPPTPSPNFYALVLINLVRENVEDLRVCGSSSSSPPHYSCCVASWLSATWPTCKTWLAG
jgi:hypothetical protein